jgi:hypothetical protein
MSKVGARDLAEAWAFRAAGKQRAVHIGELAREGLDAGCLAISGLGVHRAEDFRDHKVRVGGVAGAHLLDRLAEQSFAQENVGVFGEEAEDQPGHEVVHVLPAVLPLGVLAQQLDIEAVQAAGRLDIERAFADLLDGGDAGERQEEAEVIGKLGVGAGDRAAAREILGLEGFAVGREDELGLLGGRLGAAAQGAKGFVNAAGRAGHQVDVAALENGAGDVGLVCVAGAQALDCRVLVPKGGQKLEGELGTVKRGLRQRGYSFFDLDRVHGASDKAERCCRQQASDCFDECTEADSYSGIMAWRQGLRQELCVPNEDNHNSLWVALASAWR